MKQERRVLEEELKVCEADNETLLNNIRAAQRDSDHLRDDYNMLQQRLHDTEAQFQKTRLEKERMSRDVTGFEGSIKELRDLSHHLQREKDEREREASYFYLDTILNSLGAQTKHA